MQWTMTLTVGNETYRATDASIPIAVGNDEYDTGIISVKPWQSVLCNKGASPRASCIVHDPESILFNSLDPAFPRITEISLGAIFSLGDGWTTILPVVTGNVHSADQANVRNALCVSIVVIPRLFAQPTSPQFLSPGFFTERRQDQSLSGIANQEKTKWTG